MFAQPTQFPVTILVPDDVLFALNQPRQVFEKEARILLAVKYYETGKLSTGLAARVAGVPRSEFFHILSQHGLSPFGVEADELADDLAHATEADHLE